MENIKIYSVSPPGMMGENGNGMTWSPAEYPIGMAYVPTQVWRDKYENGKALMRGTIFAELDKPFMGGGGR